MDLVFPQATVSDEGNCLQRTHPRLPARGRHYLMNCSGGIPDQGISRYSRSPIRCVNPLDLYVAYFPDEFIRNSVRPTGYTHAQGCLYLARDRRLVRDEEYPGMTAPSGLARKSIRTGSLFFFCVGASGPMIVVAGGVVATYGATGVIGVPLSFLILAGALAFFTVGYVAMVRHVPHTATFYALVARGLGRAWGMAGGTVALVSYNAIQISLAGLVGVTIQGLVNAGTWWLWALVVWALVGLLGVLHVNINARVLAVLLICEIGIIALFDLASFTHPAQDLTFTPLSPGSLLVNGIGGVFAFGIAAFLGYETGPFYAEEARSHRVVSWATMGALGFMGEF